MSRTTDKYIKIRKEADKAPENEIRIRADARIGRYISYAATLLLEKKLDTVILKASGVATRSAVQIAEILRHRILNLHQLTQLKTISVLDEYEPREEGLDRVSIERHLAVLEITLSLKDGVLDTKQPGYQQPLPKEEVQEEDLKSLTERRRPVGREGAPRGDDRREGEGRGYGGRGGRGGRGFGGRGRGRGFGGRGGRGFGGRGGSRREGDDREEGRGYGGRGEGRGYVDRREGGYNDRREGGYNDRREGGYGDRREGGYNDRREGGYGDRREGGRGEGRGYGGRGSRGGRGYGGRGGSRGYDNERTGGDNRRTRGERRD